MVDITLEKREWRTQMRLQRKQMNEKDYHIFAEQLNSHLITYIEQVKPKAVKGFIPYSNEPNIWPFIHYCWKQAIPYIIPKCEQETVTMRWYQIEREDQLVKGAYSILEPDPIRCSEVIAEATIVLVPALAFTKQGERLGYGGGYYDRFYAYAHQKVEQWIGIAYENFIVSKLPTEVHDFNCDYIVSNAGFIRCKVEEKEDNNEFYTF